MSDSGRGIELDYRCDDRFSHIATGGIEEGSADDETAHVGHCHRSTPFVERRVRIGAGRATEDEARQ